MINKLTIQVLCDNTASADYIGEHGLSFFVKSDNINILFDTGRGYAFEHNAKVSKLNLQETDYLIFSHGHYDHTGGISDFFKIQETEKKEKENKLKILLHPNALKEKYSKTADGPKYIGISPDAKSILLKHSNITETTTELAIISPDIKLTGEIPHTNPQESGETKFYLDKNLSKPDKLLDDKALFFNTSKGIVVLLGCCHSGLGNTLDYISKIERTDNIYAVIGGTHLRSADKTRLDFTVEILKKYKISFFAPNHCTGQHSTSYIYSQMPSLIHPAPAGTVFTF